MLQVTDVPDQPNYHECGLLTLAYMDFFSFRPPLHIHHLPSRAFESDHHLLKRFGHEHEEDASFLTRAWFTRENGIAVRRHLMVQLLQGMRRRALQPGEKSRLQRQLTAARAHEEATLVQMNGKQYVPRSLGL